MVSFKLCISDPSSGKTFQREVKDSQTRHFLGLNIGESLKGDAFDFSGYEFEITGGSDYCGFPMRRGILGLRKKISIYGGIGFRGSFKGIKRRKTVCGHKIHEKTSQVNLKITKHGSKKLAEIFGVEDKKEVKEEKKSSKEEKKEIKEDKTASEEKSEIQEDKKEKHAKSEEKSAKEHKEEKKEEKHKEEKAEVKEEKKEKHAKAEEKKE